MLTEEPLKITFKPLPVSMIFTAADGRPAATVSLVPSPGSVLQLSPAARQSTALLEHPVFGTYRDNRPLRIIISMAILAAAFGAGWFANDRFGEGDVRASKSRAITLGRTKLLNPLLACEVAETTLRARELKPFKKKVSRQVEAFIAAGTAEEISVYFRDLDDGKVFEINSDRPFTPASLAKLPIMFAYFKLSQDNPALLKKKLTYSGEKDLTQRQNFKPRETLQAGKAYTVDELIFRMIAYSDNNAWQLLLNNLDRAYLHQTVVDLGADFLDDPSGAPLITVRAYSIFLRVLYNASYLNLKMSEKALEYLAVEEFPYGIAASVPKGIVVAGKFAERQYGDRGENKVLHDFGIVYHPKQPYLVCIMTKGKDFGQLASVIQAISKTIYDEIDTQTGAP